MTDNRNPEDVARGLTEAQVNLLCSTLLSATTSKEQPMTHDATDLLAVEHMARVICNASGLCVKSGDCVAMLAHGDQARAVVTTLATTNAQQAATIAAMREALDWYGEQAEATNRCMTATPPKPETMTAILTALSLDCGVRARAALARAQQKDQDNER